MVVKRSTQLAFTLTEMLVVAPVVILLIGAFVGFIVHLTGEVLVTSKQTSILYSAQDAIGRIRDDVRKSAGFLATNSVALTSPQGSDNDTAEFKNVGSLGDVLILRAFATTKNPLSIDSDIVPRKDSPLPCSSPSVGANVPLVYNIIYFVKDNSLWRRVVLPSDYTTAGCSIPWQLPSCQDDVVGGFCVAHDEEVLSNIITNSGFQLSYYSNPGTMTENSDAEDEGQSDMARASALEPLLVVGVSMTVSATVLGEPFTEHIATRVTRSYANITSEAYQ